MPTAPLLDHVAIAALLPHQGAMCLLDAVVRFDAQRLHCRATSHRRVDHPLRHGSRLGSACLVEYAAQAMALHAGLCAEPSNAVHTRARPDDAGHGVIAAVRSVNLHVDTLDAIAGDLDIAVTLMSGDATSAIYGFDVTAHGTALADGRLTVVLVTDPKPVSS